jgi:hypothetical protein
MNRSFVELHTLQMHSPGTKAVVGTGSLGSMKMLLIAGLGLRFVVAVRGMKSPKMCRCAA